MNAEVILELAGGAELVAVLTMESVRSLALEQGVRAIAVVKAPWVMVLTEASGVRSQLPGWYGRVRQRWRLERRGHHRYSGWQHDLRSGDERGGAGAATGA